MEISIGGVNVMNKISEQEFAISVLSARLNAACAQRNVAQDECIVARADLVVLEGRHKLLEQRLAAAEKDAADLRAKYEPEPPASEADNPQPEEPAA